MTRREVRVLGAPGELFDACAAELASALAAAIEARGRAAFALAGGATPREVYARLARDPAIDWPRVDLFFGDERCVPPDAPASNWRMVRETLLDRLARAPGSVHRIPGELLPEDAARAYERTLRAALPGDPPRLDLVLLGLGADGHTASLFPGDRALLTLEDGARLVVATESPEPPRFRVSLALPTLCAARRVVFLASGSSKAEAVARVLARAELLPAAMVRPRRGDILWLLDSEAAGRLQAGG